MYQHSQGSVYQRPNTTAPATWLDVTDLRSILPLGVFSSVLKSIQLFYIPHPAMILTNNMILGGALSPLLIGPTPAGLVPPWVPAQPMIAAPNPLPRYVRNTANANQGINWVIWY